MASDKADDFKSLQDGIQKALVSTTKSVNRLTAEDLGFQRAVNPAIATQLDDKTARLLGLSTRLLKSAARACGLKNAPTLEEAEDIDVNWRGVVDVVDSVLEKADTALDEYTGLVKRKDPPTTDAAQKPKKQKTTNKVVRNANITKPQIHFKKPVDNFPTGPWKPILTKKPHATVSLQKSLRLTSPKNGDSQYKHPYETEISKMEYPERVYQVAEPIPYQPAESTEATWVDTFEGVLDMLEDLRDATEIAVDLEHHDTRTYTGLVCLMQVSTREKDWIVDTLQPWRHKLEVLNEVFADPSIVKVFHGAYMDMLWLQRDLGLYINGLFDTFFACEQLYSGRSLAFLLSKFVDFDADKQYQLADWRIRPIPEEMLYYARSDTHYLLYIYDRVRNDLVEASDRSDPDKDLIGKALARSKDLSLSRRHQHPDFNEETGEGSRGWYDYVLNHAHLAFDSEQFTIFKTLWKWRDHTARKEDESPHFVLGNNFINEIAKAKPPDAKAMHSLLPYSAPLARGRVNEIWEQLQAAKAKGGPSLLQYFSGLAPEALDGKKRRKPPVSVPEAGPDVAVNRMGKSQLFGDMPISSRWEAANVVAEEEDYVPFPWQRFVQQTGNGEVAVEEVPEAAAEEPKVEESKLVETPVEDPNAEFTLKRGTKRKSDIVEREDSASSGTSDDDESEDEGEKVAASGVIDIDDDEPMGRRPGTARKAKSKKRNNKDKQAADAEKARREEAKKARRARKLEKRANRSETSSVATGQPQKKFEAVPFDYGKAASVVNAKREVDSAAVAAAGKGKGRGKAVFDPYSKTGDDAMKGARKAPPVRGERSATFRK
ncbi:3'-5' exonuclease domain-containing protein [Sarocladium implicatum]|nr:3'-5' exonuclease domain-containing protein [Sarocladium implicatum]